MSAPARPGVLAANEWGFPEPAELRLPNGARLWLYDLPSQHLISVQVVLDVPLSSEPPSLEGIATIAVRASDEGSHDHPGNALAEAIEDLGAIYSGAATTSATICRLEVPSTRLASALPLLAEIVQRPAYAPADVERHVTLRLAEIEQTMVRSSSLVQLGIRQALYAPQTRMARSPGGRAAQVAAITPEAVAGFHQQWWRPEQATIIIAGALPRNAAELAADAFAGWQPTGAVAQHLMPGANPAGPVVWVIDRPEAVQADLQLGLLGPDRSDARWAALEVAACAIGGSFASRLNRVLREERGYTYGAHAGFRPQRSGGTFAVRTSCRTEVAAAATAEALALLRLDDAPLSAVEVLDARNYLLGVAPLHFQTAETIADQAATLAATAVRPDWINAHQHRVALIEADEATQAFREVVARDALNIVLCGNAEQLLPDLGAAGLTAQVIDPQTAFS